MDRPIALNDVGKAMKQCYARQGPAIMFTRNGTDFPLVCGVYSTRNKALLAFQTDDAGLFEKVLTGLDKPIPPVIVKARRRARRWSSPATTSTSPGSRFRNTARRTAALHHARHRRLQGPGDRRSRHRPLPGARPRQEHLLLFGAAVSPVRQEPRQVQEARHRAARRPRHRVDPILAYTCQVQVPDDTNDWSVAAASAAPRWSSCVARPATSRSRHRGNGDRVRGRPRPLGDGGPARRIHRLLHEALEKAGRHRDGHHPPQEPIFQGLLTESR